MGEPKQSIREFIAEHSAGVGLTADSAEFLQVWVDTFDFYVA